MTVYEFTNGRYTELRYNAVKEPISGNFVSTLCNKLNKCGCSVAVKNTYDQDVALAVAAFQDKIGMSSSGILTDMVLTNMDRWIDKNMSDTVGDAGEEATTSSTLDESENPHYQSFFNTDNFKTHRRNQKDIVIAFGKSTITKKLKNVFMRSVSLQVDTSGNPISEQYEFIARDLEESDEPMDAYRAKAQPIASDKNYLKYPYKASNNASSSSNSNYKDLDGTLYSGGSGPLVGDFDNLLA